MGLALFQFCFPSHARSRRYRLLLALNHDGWLERQEERAKCSSAGGRRMWTTCDGECRGTWAGVREDGRFAFMIPLRESDGRRASLPRDGAKTFRSRGRLVQDFLEERADAIDYVQLLQQQHERSRSSNGAQQLRYKGYNFVCGDGRKVAYFSNCGTVGAVLLSAARMYVLSTAVLGAPMPRVEHASLAFQMLVRDPVLAGDARTEARSPSLAAGAIAGASSSPESSSELGPDFATRSGSGNVGGGNGRQHGDESSVAPEQCLARLLLRFLGQDNHASPAVDRIQSIFMRSSSPENGVAYGTRSSVAVVLGTDRGVLLERRHSPPSMDSDTAFAFPLVDTKVNAHPHADIDGGSDEDYRSDDDDDYAADDAPVSPPQTRTVSDPEPQSVPPCGGVGTKRSLDEESTCASGKHKKLTRDPNAPAGAISASNFFAMEQRALMRSDDEAANGGATDAEENNRRNKLIGERWKALSAKERRPYEDMSAQDHVRYWREWWIYTPSPGFCKKEHRGKPPPCLNLPTQLPSRPKSAYMWYLTKGRESIAAELKGDFQATQRCLAEQWSKMTKEQKRPYHVMNTEDKWRYTRELTDLQRSTLCVRSFAHPHTHYSA